MFPFNTSSLFFRPSVYVISDSEMNKLKAERLHQRLDSVELRLEAARDQLKELEGIRDAIRTSLDEILPAEEEQLEESKSDG